MKPASILNLLVTVIAVLLLWRLIVGFVIAGTMLFAILAAFLFVIAAAIDFVFKFAVALFETNHVQPYHIPAAGKAFDPSDKAILANAELLREGFRKECVCHDQSNWPGRSRDDIWVGDDRRILAIVVSGKLAWISLTQLRLISCTESGKVLATTSGFGGVDISGLEDSLEISNAMMTTLLAEHERRLSACSATRFSANKPLVDYFEIRKRKAERLVALGYAKYVAADQSAWRYTLRGAIRFYIVSAWVRPTQQLAQWLRHKCGRIK